MNTDRRIVRSKCRTIKRARHELPPPQEGRYATKVKCQTRIGWHKVGERGDYKTQGNGVGYFFPDRGGVVELPYTDVVDMRVREKRESYPVPPSLAALGIRFTPARRGTRSREIAKSCKPEKLADCKVLQISRKKKKNRRVSRETR